MPIAPRDRHLIPDILEISQGFSGYSIDMGYVLLLSVLPLPGRLRRSQSPTHWVNSAKKGGKDEIVRLHMQLDVTKRAANRAAVLRVTTPICLIAAGTDMRHMHAHTCTCVHSMQTGTFCTRARHTHTHTHGALLSPDISNDTGLFFRRSDLDLNLATRLQRSSHNNKKKENREFW